MSTKKMLPLAAMEKVMKEAGANRVAENAKEALKEALEDIALEISEKAVKYASHAGRRTVLASDVKLAMK